jgi:predicted RNA-binding Zn-ribbon protein involved in translation (DUF1610 family)
MRPAHPCPACGHETIEQCTAVAEAINLPLRTMCPHCQHACVHRSVAEPTGTSVVARTPVEPPAPVPEPPMPTPEPGGPDVGPPPLMRT